MILLPEFYAKGRCHFSNHILIMSHYDWSKFSLKVDIRATPIAVYNAWATPANLESWFLRKALFTTPDGKLRDESAKVQAGDTYLWRWHGYDDKTQEKAKSST